MKDIMKSTYIGVLTIITGIFQIHFLLKATAVDTNVSIDSELYWIVICAFIVTGFFILMFRDWTKVYQSLALACIPIGLFFVSHIPLSVYEFSFFLIYLTYCFIGLGIIVFSICLWRRKKKFAMSLFILIAIGSAMLFIQSMNDAWIPNHLLKTFIEFSYNYPRFLLFGSCALMLLMNDVRTPSALGLLRNGASSVMASGYTDSEAYVYRKDLIDILKHRYDSGDERIIFEKDYTIHSIFGDRVLKIRKWKGEEFVRAMVCSSDGGNGYPFEITHIVPSDGGFDDCTSVKIYGRNGFFAVLTVVNEPIKYKDS